MSTIPNVSAAIYIGAYSAQMLIARMKPEPGGIVIGAPNGGKQAQQAAGVGDCEYATDHAADEDHAQPFGEVPAQNLARRDAERRE